MFYTDHYNKNSEKKERFIIPIAIFLVTLLMFPIGGTNYLQIIFAVLAFMVIMYRRFFTNDKQDLNLEIYFRYFVISMFISAIVGLVSGVSLKSELFDVLTSSLPYMCMLLGSYYATKFSEKKHVKWLAIILIIEFVMGLGQNVSEGFRNFTFELYDARSRLVSYHAEDVGRAVGTLRSPNYYGIVCVILGTVFIGLLFDEKARQKRINKIYNMCLCFIVLAVVVFSVSKTAVICISCVFVFCAFFSSSMNTSTKIGILVLCLIAIAILIPEFEAYSNRQINLTSMSGRNENWQRILELGFTGKMGRIFIGFGNGYSIFSNIGVYADSYYIILLFEQGLIGALAYFAIWIAIGINTLRRKPSIYRTYTLILICIMLLSDITAAITDMPIVCIIIYYMIGRYSTLSIFGEEAYQQEEGLKWISR